MPSVMRKAVTVRGGLLESPHLTDPTPLVWMELGPQHCLVLGQHFWPAARALPILFITSVTSFSLQCELKFWEEAGCTADPVGCLNIVTLERCNVAGPEPELPWGRYLGPFSSHWLAASVPGLIVFSVGGNSQNALLSMAELQPASTKAKNVITRKPMQQMFSLL
jgi:hypothetical protein